MKISPIFGHFQIFSNLTAGMRGGVDWMRKLAFRFRKIKENYNIYRNNVGALLGIRDQRDQDKWMRIRQDLETQTDVRNFPGFF